MLKSKLEDRTSLLSYKEISWFSIGSKVWIVDGNHGHLHGATILGEPFRIPSEDYLEDKEKKKIIQELKGVPNHTASFDPCTLIDGGICVVYALWIECGRKDIVECCRISGPIFVANEEGRQTRRGRILPSNIKRKRQNLRINKKIEPAILEESISPKADSNDTKNKEKPNKNDERSDSSITLSDDNSVHETIPQHIEKKENGSFIKTVQVIITAGKNNPSKVLLKYKVFSADEISNGIFFPKKKSQDIKEKNVEQKGFRQKNNIKKDSVINRVKKNLSHYRIKKLALSRLNRRHRRLPAKAKKQGKSMESFILSPKGQFNASIKPHEVLLLAKHPHFDFGDSDMSDCTISDEE